MSLGADDLAHLAAVAQAAALEAGQFIGRSRPTGVTYKADGASLASQVVTEIDLESEAMIVDRLAVTMERFGLALLTEERADDGGRLSAPAYWCVDPLDGTLPFTRGEPGYAVSIALVRRDGTPLIGVVYDPVEGQLWSASSGGGLVRDGEPWHAPTSTDQLTVFADRSFLAAPDHEATIAALDALAADLGLAGSELRVGAGGVLNACGVISEPPACYLKFPADRGGGSLWDFAATACLATEAGVVVADVFGDPLDLNRPDSTAMHHRGVLYASSMTVADGLRRLHRARS